MAITRRRVLLVCLSGLLCIFAFVALVKRHGDSISAVTTNQSSAAFHLTPGKGPGLSNKDSGSTTVNRVGSTGALDNRMTVVERKLESLKKKAADDTKFTQSLSERLSQDKQVLQIALAKTAAELKETRNDLIVAKSLLNDHLREAAAAVAAAAADSIYGFDKAKDSGIDSSSTRMKVHTPSPPVRTPDPTPAPTLNRKGARASARTSKNTKSKSPSTNKQVRTRHYVFSTSCSMYQQWQSELLFWSHNRANPDADGVTITRLVSGCEAKPLTYDEMKHTVPGSMDVLQNLTILEISTNPKAQVRKTPELPESRTIIYSNKPYAVVDWVDHQEQVTPNDVVVILDPDTLVLSRESWGFLPRSKAHYPLIDVAAKKPVAQHYMIGTAWVNALDAQYLNGDSVTARVCGKNSNCATVSESYASEHLEGGPPMILDASDLKSVTYAWKNFTTELNKITDAKEMIAEMMTYSMALAHLEANQTLTNSLMISATDMDWTEAWEYMGPWTQKEDQDDEPIQNLSCHDPFSSIGDYLPSFLHYCQFYRAYDSVGHLWAFHKGHVPPYIFDCDMPLLKMPPDDLFNVQTTWRGRREALTICLLHASINMAAVDYSKKFCPAKLHKKKVPRIRIMNDFVPHTVRTCDAETDNRFCFDYALLEPQDPTVGDANISASSWVKLHVKPKVTGSIS